MYQDPLGVCLWITIDTCLIHMPTPCAKRISIPLCPLNKGTFCIPKFLLAFLKLGDTHETDFLIHKNSSPAPPSQSQFTSRRRRNASSTHGDWHDAGNTNMHDQGAVWPTSRWGKGFYSTLLSCWRYCTGR